ncbi:MAG TPA: hypothetical protein VHO90_06040 [Bacteroidales bacterium]|nr:hypothetical protein [Bacteroidales bacterium]
MITFLEVTISKNLEIELKKQTKSKEAKPKIIKVMYRLIEEYGIADLRSKAEILLREKYSENESEFTEADVLKLFHELEVYQIELKLQSEELLLSRSEAQTAAAKYTYLYNASPMCLFTLSADGRILELVTSKKVITPSI